MVDIGAGHLVANPNDDLAEGKRWYNWVWYQWEDNYSLKKILTDKSGHYYSLWNTSEFNYRGE